MARKAPKNNSIMDSSDFSDTPAASITDTPAALNQARKMGRESGEINTPTCHSITVCIRTDEYRYFTQS
jgi:hypothetical protein